MIVGSHVNLSVSASLSNKHQHFEYYQQKQTRKISDTSEIESITQFAPQYYKFSVKMPQWNAAGRYNIIIYAIKRAIVATPGRP